MRSVSNASALPSGESKLRQKKILKLGHAHSLLVEMATVAANKDDIIIKKLQSFILNHFQILFVHKDSN